VDYDVLVAGAGPAGTATAAALVRRGVSPAKILVVDRARFPRPKPCGGGLTGHAAAAMRALGFELAVPHVPSPRARVVCGAIDRTVRLPQPVEIIRREEFDRCLVEQTRAMGVEIRENAALRDFRIDAGMVEARTESGAVRARVLVGADGAGSIVRKRLIPREARPIRLFRAELACKRADDAMVYDFSPMRPGSALRGYLWIFPVAGDRINVGLMHDPVTQRSGSDLTALLRTELERHGVTLDGEARGWPAWGYHPRTRVAVPHLVLVGDAAGIDGLTGEGIAVALEQGLVAADAIARALDDGDFRFRGYRRALRRATVGRDLAIDRWLARLLYRGKTERWLGFLLEDPKMLDLYAARVAGGVVLADRKADLIAAFGRYLAKGKPVCWS
jgi:geranylgeranyl reductase family protein